MKWNTACWCIDSETYFPPIFLQRDAPPFRVLHLEGVKIRVVAVPGEFCVQEIKRGDAESRGYDEGHDPGSGAGRFGRITTQSLHVGGVKLKMEGWGMEECRCLEEVDTRSQITPGGEPGFQDLQPRGDPQCSSHLAFKSLIKWDFTVY